MSNIVFTGTDTEQIFCFTHPITSYISNKSKIKSKISLVLYTSKWYTDIRNLQKKSNEMKKCYPGEYMYESL